MKTKKSLLGCCLLILSFFVFTSCKNKSANSENTVYLGENWMYTLVNPFANDARFDLLVDDYLYSLHELVPKAEGTIWLKKTFTVPESLVGEDISCYLGRITLADRTYINGQLIGTEGFFPPKVFSAWNTTRFYEIPEALLKDGENTLIVEIYVCGEGSIVSDPFIGLHNEAKKAAEWERFWNSKINLLFAFFMIIIAAYHLIIYSKDITQKENLWFALVNITTVLYMFVFYVSELPGLPTNNFSFLWFQKIFSSGMPFLLIYMLCSFVNSYLHRKDRRIFKILRLVFLILPLLVIFTIPNYKHLRETNGVVQSFLFLPLLYMSVILIVSVFKKRKDALALLIGFTPFIIAGVADLVIHNVLKIYEFPYISMIGWQVVIIALLFILANRFSNARNQATYLNKHLTDEVEKQTKELSESNGHLNSVVSELNAAKEKSEKDLKMAVYVQQSIYQRIPPFVDGWDIAFKFSPKAGVSGDLYDFLADRKDLLGLALFDVSGQGLAAGLISLLAKSVIDEEFFKFQGDHLGGIMKNINQAIIEKKGNIDNYLKGALLRINGDKVEYINAGGPTIFLRSGKTGKCSPVELPNSTNEEERTIGSVSSNTDFKVIGFKMNPGDSLILYTKTLSDSTDDYGKPYSKNRIARVFGESGDGNAQFKLNSVIADFEQYRAGKPLDDDLTVIVLQKQ